MVDEAYGERYKRQTISLRPLYAIFAFRRCDVKKTPKTKVLVKKKKKEENFLTKLCSPLSLFHSLFIPNM